MDRLTAIHDGLFDQTGILIQLETAGQHDVFAAQLQILQVSAGTHQHRIARLGSIDGGLDGRIFGRYLPASGTGLQPEASIAGPTGCLKGLFLYWKKD